MPKQHKRAGTAPKRAVIAIDSGAAQTANQRNGVIVLFRQASTWLQKWHEPTIVGTAVALFGLAYLLPLATRIEAPVVSSGLSQSHQPTAYALGLYDVPRDDQFYRDKWIAEAAAFYAANPPKESEPQSAPSPVITASMRTAVESTTGDQGRDQPKVAQVSYIDQPPNGQAKETSQTAGQTAMALPAKAQRWRVLTCLAAGLLASLLFASVWPANETRHQATVSNDRPLEVVGRGEAIPIQIPAAWIGLRPTLRQTARRSVLSGSYLVAALGAWGVVF